MITLLTSDFTFNKRKNLMYAEASDLPECASVIPHRFNVQSHVTDTIVRFELDRRVCDRDGDVLYWAFRSKDVTVELHILND